MTGNTEPLVSSPTESTASELGSPKSTASYFPSSHRSSVSSISSATAIITETEQAIIKLAQPPKAKQATAVLVPALSSAVSAPPRPVRQDAMTKTFPKPTRELSVEEMLARPAQKYSLGHYIKNARDCRMPVVDKAKSAQDFADVKRELLRAKEDLQRLSIIAARQL
ncbi:hypothetical protein B0T22DRAFT_475443 [Podospora appendiculata]|uniref:Uncharacterized protein n=1 Tax=Podospora appendiculata TaxID=314037 RepID=A0AAE1CFE5_9PEZI|nr:hypothetical protein B0T22DRAFT_475443 [Podospora appendiculata]